MRSPGRARRLLLPVFVLALLGCTETDDVIRAIASAQLSLVDPGVAPTSLTADATIQGTRWVVLKADLQLGADLGDLRAGAACEFQDTFIFTPGVIGKCRSGIVIGSSEQALSATLDLELEMQVHRAEPGNFPLSPTGDFDGDQVQNGSDNCPLAANPPSDCDSDPMTPDEQCDVNGDGIGDACQIDAGSGIFILDSDGDRVSDGADNCIYFANPTQADTAALSPAGWFQPDGVGDACPFQSARVEIAGDPTVRLLLGPLSVLPTTGGQGIFSVVFDASELNCDWNAGACQLDPAQVTFTFTQIGI